MKVTQPTHIKSYTFKSMRKFLTKTSLSLILLALFLTFFVRTGVPESSWETKIQREDITEKFKSVNEGTLFTQKKEPTNLSCQVKKEEDMRVELHQTTPQLSPTELKYRLRKKFNNRIAFCGPSVVVISLDPSERFKQFPVIMKNTEEFQVILRQKNLTNAGHWSNQDKQIVIHEHNILSAISLEPIGGGKYKFRLRILQSKAGGFTKEEPVAQMSPQLPTNAFAIEGYIDQHGVIDITKQKPIFHQCPR